MRYDCKFNIEILIKAPLPPPLGDSVVMDLIKLLNQGFKPRYRLLLQAVI